MYSHVQQQKRYLKLGAVHGHALLTKELSCSEIESEATSGPKQQLK